VRAQASVIATELAKGERIANREKRISEHHGRVIEAADSLK
jgi:hypothetical protein